MFASVTRNDKSIIYLYQGAVVSLLDWIHKVMIEYNCCEPNLKDSYNQGFKFHSLSRGCMLTIKRENVSLYY
jgi:hypothetical protein